MVAFGIEGLEEILLNPLGPVHDHVAVPVEVVVAFSVSVPPAHTGLLLVSWGEAGGFGSANVTGPAKTFETQPFKLTVILVYTPAERLVIRRLPLAAERIVTGPTVVPFLI